MILDKKQITYRAFGTIPKKFMFYTRVVDYNLRLNLSFSTSAVSRQENVGKGMF